MYDRHYGGGEDEEITQEDAWSVISAYFEEKGLVRQQLDSFDEFIQNTMQEIVDQTADIEIRSETQHNPGQQSDFLEVTLDSVAQAGNRCGREFSVMLGLVKGGGIKRRFFFNYLGR